MATDITRICAHPQQIRNANFDTGNKMMEERKSRDSIGGTQAQQQGTHVDCWTHIL